MDEVEANDRLSKSPRAEFTDRQTFAIENTSPQNSTEPLASSSARSDFRSSTNFIPVEDRRSKAYRVQGIPLDRKRRDVQKLIASILRLETDHTTVALKSLAISADGQTKTAVFSSSENHDLLSPEQSEWAFPISDGYDKEEQNNQNSDDDDLVPRGLTITIDTHFRGLTVLRSFSKESDHKTEYV